MEFKDYYAILGVPKTASEKEIKQAYRKLARKHHPDVNPGSKAAEARFKELNEAHAVLADPEKRRRYDALGANWEHYARAQSTYGPSAGSPFDAGAPFEGWNVWFGGSPGGSATMHEEDVQDLFAEGGPFSDFFKTFFGGMPQAERPRGTRNARARVGRDVEQEIELTLEEAFRGTTRRLSIRHNSHTRTVEVRIPPGISSGSRVRVAGEGQSGGGRPPGDLYLRVRLRPHSRFERKGNDLYLRVTVPVTRAVLGGEADVPALDGTRLRLRVPPLTQQGQTLRLRGQGMPVAGRPGERGDLYVAVDVQLPSHLSPEERQLYVALAGLERTSSRS